MKENKQVAPTTLAFAVDMLRLFAEAVANAQAENRALGIPNVYSINGTLFQQLPNGEIRTLK